MMVAFDILERRAAEVLMEQCMVGENVLSIQLDHSVLIRILTTHTLSLSHTLTDTH